MFTRWIESYAITNRPLSGRLKYATRELETVADLRALALQGRRTDKVERERSIALRC